MRILYVTCRYPWPPRRGDQARAAGLAARLAERHQVRVVSMGTEGGAPPPGVETQTVPAPGPLRCGLSGLSSFARSRPFQSGFFCPPSLTRTALGAAKGFRPDVAVVTLSRAGDVALALHRAGVPVLLDFVDALTANMRRRAQREASLKRLAFGLEARFVEPWERRLALSLPRATVVSEDDRQAMLDGGEAVQQRDLSRRLEVLPFGLEIPTELVPLATRSRVMLSGNLGYFPTIDGASWFAREVWPRVREACPEARWLLAGARPPARVLGLASPRRGIEVVSDPEDLASLRRSSAVSVAPLRAGSGTAIKILEAMADGVPVVATSRACRGLDGIRGDELLLGDSAESFAAAVALLLRERQVAEAQRQRAFAWLRPRHELGGVSRRLEELLRQTSQREALGRETVG